MRLQRLKLVNFRQHRDTEISFGPGITGIIGPNGAGKTTLLEAIAFAMYGVKAARGGRDSIRWRRAKPRAEVRVELEFGLGPHVYRVVRTLFNAELYLDGSAQPIVSGVTDVSDKLTRTVRMTRDEFFKTYFTGQKDLAVMAELGPADRRRFLNRLLDYDRLLSAQRKVRETSSAMRAELSGLMAHVPDPRALAAERDSRAAEDAAARQRLADAEEKLETAKAASDQHLPVFSGLKEFQERHRALTGQRGIAAERVTHAVELVGRLEKERDEAVALAAQRAGQLEELGRRVEQAKVAAGQVKDLLVKLESARNAVEAAGAAYEERRGAWDRDRADADAQRRTLRDQFKDIKTHKDRITALGAEGVCPTCGRRLGSEFGTVLETLDNQLAAVTQNGQYFSQRVEQLADMPDDVKALDQKRHDAQHQVEQLGQEVAVARRAADEAVQLEKQRQRLAAEGERLPRLEKELVAAAARRAGLVEALSEVERELTSLAFNEESFLAVEKEMKRLEVAWHEADRRVSTARAEATLAGERLREAERRIEEAAGRLARTAELQKEVRLHAELDRAFDDLSAELNREIGPELSALASGFMASLTDGASDEVQLDDEFNATVYQDGEARPVLSGGEEDLVNLVLRLGVSQMIADRSGQPLSLLVLDEIFGSLDELRRQSVVHLLRGLESRFPQVILITHVEGVREALDRVLRVRFDESSGAAVVSEERGPAGLPEPAGGGADDAHVAA